jgi:hypothetical protein
VIIKEILNQSRRDFNAIYECEHCKTQVQDFGYDDFYFHNHVVPSMICSSCNKKSNNEYKPLTPKYSESTII